MTTMITKETNIEKDTNGHFVIRGELNFANIPKIEHIGYKLIDKSESNSVFDFSEATIIDNATLALLIAWMHHAKLKNKTVKFVKPSQQLLDMAKLSGLETLLPIVNNV